MVIAVFGLPGSGKSFFASKLAEKLRIKYVNSDVIRRNLIGVRIYSEDEKMQVYDEMIKEMKTALDQDENIVMDATFYRKDIRNKFREVALTAGVNIYFIEIRADQDIIKERLSKKRQHSEADYSVYLKVKDGFEPMENDHLILNSTQQNICDMLDKALAHITKTDEESPHK